MDKYCQSFKCVEDLPIITTTLILVILIDIPYQILLQAKYTVLHDTYIY